MNTTRALTVATLAVAAAGCGSSGPPTNTRQSSSANPGAAAYRYADCMRSHGVSGFPDPRVSIHGNSVSVIQGLPPSAAHSPHFKSAQKACSGIIPAPNNARADQGHKQAFLAFARCMRGKGLSDFPDPNSQGQITQTMLSAAGVDLRSHTFYRAAIACAPLTHGLITAAQVQQAVSGQH